jgi:hypothetical protein
VATARRFPRTRTHCTAAPKSAINGTSEGESTEQKYHFTKTGSGQTWGKTPKRVGKGM